MELDNHHLIYIQRLIPAGTVVEVRPGRKGKKGSTVKKGDKIGTFKFRGAVQIFELCSPLSGKVTWSIGPEPITCEQERRPGEILVFKIKPCEHELVFDGVCSECFQHCRQRESQLIFDKISNISAKGKLVEDKVNELT